MANMTDAMENQIVDGITGVTSLFSSTMSLALFTADPTNTGSVVNEYTGNGYARKPLTTLFSSASGGTASNTSAVDFATATGDWAEITHYGFMLSDVETTDDMHVVGTLVTPITLLDTQVFSFAIGALTVTAT